jgi:hypothetical protein
MNDLKLLLFLLLLLSLEIILLGFLLVSILLRRIQFLVQQGLSEKIRANISAFIEECLEHETPFKKKWVFYARYDLLSCMEAFNHRLKGESWDRLKEQIVSEYLIKRARRSAKSFFWVRRNFAARVFALCPFLKDEALVLSLLEDPEFLVGGVAALAALQLESKKGIERILSEMSRAKGYPYYFYRDILLQGSLEALSLLKELTIHSKDPSIHLASLGVFASKTVPFALPFLERDLHSKSPEIRRAAFKTLVRNPNKEAFSLFMEALDDNDKIVRVQGLLGIEPFTDKESLSKIKEALKDEAWVVRIQAAESLKKRGEVPFLKKIDSKTNQLVYEAVQYALEFGV